MICWIQVTSGRGPAECCWVVAQVARCILEEATVQNLDAHILEAIPGEKPHTHKSALLALEGDALSAFVRKWTGTVQWIGKSLFRPHHKRKNWFVGVDILDPSAPCLWADKDLRIETMKASGPGGQHVNKTETAVRATLMSTGLSAVAREERSQHLNRNLALARLAKLVQEEENSRKLRKQQERWTQHNTLERGNPIRVYEGKKFRLRK